LGDTSEAADDFISAATMMAGNEIEKKKKRRRGAGEREEKEKGRGD
jgi:hypothetical protein